MICTKCSSKQLVNQQVDSDRHNNPATQVNQDCDYDAYNLKRLQDGRLQRDVDTVHCLDCGHEGEPWSDGPAPGDTLLLVKLESGRIMLATLLSNPCVWFSDHDKCLSTVVAWRHI